MAPPEILGESTGGLHLDFFDTFRPVLNMLHRAVLCLTAFLASAGVFSGSAQTGPYVQGQYLLGLGAKSHYISRLLRVSSFCLFLNTSRHRGYHRVTLCALPRAVRLNAKAVLAPKTRCGDEYDGQISQNIVWIRHPLTISSIMNIGLCKFASNRYWAPYETTK